MQSMWYHFAHSFNKTEKYVHDFQQNIRRKKNEMASPQGTVVFIYRSYLYYLCMCEYAHLCLTIWSDYDRNPKQI